MKSLVTHTHRLHSITHAAFLFENLLSYDCYDSLCPSDKHSFFASPPSCARARTYYVYLSSVSPFLTFLSCLACACSLSLLHLLILSLTVTLQTSLPLKAVCHPQITVSNLLGAHAPDGMIVLSAASSNYFAAFGNWSTSSFELAIDADIDANTDYTFAFMVTNPKNHQASPDVTIRLSGIYPTASLTPILQAMTKDKYNAASAYNPDYLNLNGAHQGWWSKEGTAAPLHVRMLAIEVGQSATHHSSSFNSNSSMSSRWNPSGNFTYPSNALASQSNWYPCSLNRCA